MEEQHREVPEVGETQIVVETDTGRSFKLQMDNGDIIEKCHESCASEVVEGGVREKGERVRKVKKVKKVVKVVKKVVKKKVPMAMHVDADVRGSKVIDPRGMMDVDGGPVAGLKISDSSSSSSLLAQKTAGAGRKCVEAENMENVEVNEGVKERDKDDAAAENVKSETQRLDDSGKVRKIEETGGNEEMVNVDDSVTWSGHMIYSGELEVLKRRKKRKTQIFVGGLNLEASEEDIRNVFGEVGDLLEVNLMMNKNTGKSRGYAFLKYASEADAKMALEKLPTAEVRGKQCTTSTVESNDTLFLGNLDKAWKNDDINRALKEMGIEKVDMVTLMADTTNPERNRGYAFAEFETNRDAQFALKKLQFDLPEKHKNIKVSWAQHLNEPDEEVLLKVKTVFVEYIPSSWDEEKVRSCFKRFGEIEKVVLSRNLLASKRKDFAFITFGVREATMACIEFFNCQKGDVLPEVSLKVSIAKPIPKNKLHKKAFHFHGKEIFSEKLKGTVGLILPARCPAKGFSSAINNTPNVSNISRSSGLEELLADRALRRKMQPITGLANPDYSYYYSSGRKRAFSSLACDSYRPNSCSDTRMFVKSCFQDGQISHGTNYQAFGKRFSSDYRHEDNARRHQRVDGYGRGSLYNT